MYQVTAKVTANGSNGRSTKVGTNRRSCRLTPERQLCSCTKSHITAKRHVSYLVLFLFMCPGYWTYCMYPNRSWVPCAASYTLLQSEKSPTTVQIGFLESRLHCRFKPEPHSTASSWASRHCQLIFLFWLSPVLRNLHMTSPIPTTPGKLIFAFFASPSNLELPKSSAKSSQIPGILCIPFSWVSALSPANPQE